MNLTDISDRIAVALTSFAQHETNDAHIQLRYGDTQEMVDEKLDARRTERLAALDTALAEVTQTATEEHNFRRAAAQQAPEDLLAYLTVSEVGEVAAKLQLLGSPSLAELRTLLEQSPGRTMSAVYLLVAKRVLAGTSPDSLSVRELPTYRRVIELVEQREEEVRGPKYRETREALAAAEAMLMVARSLTAQARNDADGTTDKLRKQTAREYASNF